ncbi:MAG: TraM recognition domain-containing protein [Intrasporangium sp.]|uniref:type IV secretory system conjugative DNA transfer family protein n=1 Tax=Intrasporangium sp. TaxID=1925024 RepID=UPI00264733A8|nr:TraM recognition domain-containing protein [Intrasporangium sp.]MDN5797510.1 TraM recognition domain-containing protein [Intrasporangium sp.]
MSRPNNRLSQPGQGNATPFLILAGTALFACCAIYVAVNLARRIEGSPALSENPIELLAALIKGRVSWPPAATWVLIGLGVLLFLAALVVAVLIRRRRGTRTRVDDASRYLGTGRDIGPLSLAAVTAQAARLGVTHPDEDETPPPTGALARVRRHSTPRPPTGVPIGQAVRDGRNLYGSYEDTHLDIWGPRTGKTTSRAIPAILAAPGAVVATSNKRDLVDATRDVRAPLGPVWVFDPQQIAGEEPNWWWNPLSYVTDEVRAARLAGHFAAGSRPAGAKTDAYFDPAGQDLLAALLLAAAIAERPITQVYTWLTLPKEDEAVDILQRAGFALTADQLAGVIGAPEKQRGGIFGTAQQMANCLTNRAVARWVTPQPGRRAHFNPTEFVTSRGTLYSLSKEGQGTAGPLVTALTVATVEAAEELATVSAGGRMPTPMLCILDEAANVCRWKDLPDLYSHFGSRGILPMTILQSWSQGVEVWGASGMQKLWSAANIKVYGGGVSEVQFLEHLAQVIGDYERVTSSTSTSTRQGGRSISRQIQRSKILEVSDLAALPRGRAIVIASGSRPTMIRTKPWMEGPDADRVRASFAAHDPGQRRANAVAREATSVTTALEPRPTPGDLR